jgi:Mg2+ and Co2+ transporter CorA
MSTTIRFNASSPTDKKSSPSHSPLSSHMAYVGDRTYSILGSDDSSRENSPIQQGRPSMVSGVTYSRRPSISSNIPRQQRSFSITSNDFTLPIPHVPSEESLSPHKFPSAQKSFKKPSPSSSGQEAYPYHMNIVPELHTNIADLLSQIDFKATEKRFMVIGLDYESRVHQEFDEMWASITNSFKKRGKKLNDEVTMMDLCGDTIDRGEPIWVDVQQPSEEDMNKIEKNFNLHPLTTEDCTKNDTGEKWELFEDYMFVVFTAQIDDENTNGEATTQLNVLVYENYVLTIHEKPIKGLDLVVKRIGTEFEIDTEEGGTKNVPVLNTPQQTPGSAINPHHIRLLPELTSSMTYKYDVSRSITKRTLTPAHTNTSNATCFNTPATTSIDDSIHEKRRKTAIPSSDWVLYAFLDATVDMYIPYVDSLLQEVENLDELVFVLSSDEHDDLLRRIGITKKNIVGLRRLLYPKQKMTSYLLSQELKFISEIVKVYLRDVLDHLAICIDKLELARENLMHTHSNYLTKVQIEIAQSSSRTDDFMNRITVLAAIIAPLTLVSGLWGMNVQVIYNSCCTCKYIIGSRSIFRGIRMVLWYY